MNEIGVRRLPYPGKGSAIGEIVEWFDKEIQALPGAIMKADKNFLCYCLAGVLTMLYENASSGHLEGLEAIMNSCDASLLDDITRSASEALEANCEEMVGFARLALCHRWFPCCVRGKDVCCMVQCLEIADTEFCFLRFDVGREYWQGWV
jgi:hypothetical protein